MSLKAQEKSQDKASTVAAYRRGPKDTGSPEVQIALLSERTNGRIKIEVMNNGVLGGEKDTIEQTRFGVIDMNRVNMVVHGAGQLAASNPYGAWEQVEKEYQHFPEDAEITRLAENDHVTPAAIRYINRLSDHLFVLSRWLNDKGRQDVLWTPGANR